MFYHVQLFDLDNYNRVLLNDSENVSQNYINASYIHGSLQDEEYKMFIATQGPLHSTIEKFWKLILSKNIKLVIMLSLLSENGRVYAFNIE